MRYTVFLLALTLLVIMALPMVVRADAEESGDEGAVAAANTSADAPAEATAEESGVEAAGCPESAMAAQAPCGGAAPCTGVCPSMGEEGPEGAEAPSEPSWIERPWDIWRHMDEQALDQDAIEFLGKVRTIAILPFVDNTTVMPGGGGTNLAETGGSERIVSNLAAEFMSRGYLVIPPGDAEAVTMSQVRGVQSVSSMGQEAINNSLYFTNMPQRAMDFYTGVVPGLARQELGTSGAATNYFMVKDDIMAVAETLGADCVIRGFITDFNLTKEVDANWRTFIPPFIGLLDPQRRVTIRVSYYLYDGKTGDLVWNGSSDVRGVNNWPMFESERDLIVSTEQQAVTGVTSRILPNWEDLVWEHPEWVPFEMWYENGGEGMEGYRELPDWVNPLRRGWHEEYDRSGMRLPEACEQPAPEVRYRDLTHNYNSIRGWLEHATE